MPHAACGGEVVATPIAMADVGMTFSPPGRPVTQALEGVNLKVGGGEFVSVVGESGCGKTTLLRILAGLTQPTHGQVTMGDREVTKPRRDVSMMFQSPTLLPWRKVLGNVLLPLEVRGKVTAEDEESALSLLEKVGLGEFPDRWPHELSGGMQQRAALCRAMIADPEVLLLDEPFGALDAMTRDQMNLDLNRMWSRRNVTTVLITHSISEAVFLSQKVVVMSPRPGRVVDVIDVPLPNERDSEMLDSPEFAHTAARVRHHFQGGDRVAVGTIE